MDAAQHDRLASWSMRADPLPAGIDLGTRPDAGTLGRVLDEIDYGVVLIDGAAQVLYANARAMRECSLAGGLRIDDGRIRPRSPEHGTAFRSALLASRQGRRSMLALPAAQTLLSVAIVPLGAVPTGAPATLLMLGKRAACEPLSVELFARAHGLTAAEGAVLRRLASGQRPVQIARETGVAIATIRTQLSVIRAKTATASICALLHRIAALPPIAPALHEAVRLPAGPGGTAAL